MPPEKPVPGSPADWLRHARSDLALAHIALPPEVLREELCFHAQQAAEKAVKAVIVAYKIAYPKTHNIRTLLDCLPKKLDLPRKVHDAAGLTDYAVMLRYPGNMEPVTQQEYREALRLAEAVVDWAEKEIKV